MFSLLETGTATDIKDFLSKMKLVLENEGYTTEYYGINYSGSTARGDKLVVSKNNNYFYFAAGINEDVFCLDDDDLGRWQAFEGISHYYYNDLDLSQGFGRHVLSYNSSKNPVQYPIINEMNMNITDGIVENYWIYKNTDECFVVVLEYNPGSYTQFMFGGVRIFDESRTLAQVSTSSIKKGYSGSSLPSNLEDSHRALWSNDIGDGQVIRYNGNFYTKDLGFTDSRTVEMLYFNQDTFIPNWSYTVEDEFPSFCIYSTYYGDINGAGSLMGRTKVKFNDKNFPIPMKVWVNIKDSKYQDISSRPFQPMFEIDGFYNINFETIQPTEVITFGTKQFICFPHYQKNNPQDYQGDEKGRGLGIALRIA